MFYAVSSSLSSSSFFPLWKYQRKKMSLGVRPAQSKVKHTCRRGQRRQEERDKVGMMSSEHLLAAPLNYFSVGPLCFDSGFVELGFCIF